ncbi:MAG: imelysin [Sphingobacteriales bacterium]|nr:imelysin [Sphingobacteriales bacterium]
MKKFNLICAFLVVALLVTSCKKDETITPTADYKDILSNIGENVILQTYEDLAAKAQNLYIAAQTLKNNPTSANLEGAKAAWVETRLPWEQSEGFLFGPVEQEGLDPSLDSWPVNVTDLNNVLLSNNALTAEFLDQQEGTLKGFHTIEFLLWSESSNKQIADFTSREFEYLVAAAEVLSIDAQELYYLWKPDGENFIKNILDAGNGSQVYISQKSALEEITNALIIISDEVANGKINDPFSQQDLSLEESRFSANSKADFTDNMRSIQNIYTGKFSTFGNGKSLSTIVGEKNSSVNTEVLQQINVAIAAIENIPGTFSDAVFNNPTSVQAAQTAVRNLQKTLEEKVLPIISNL